MMLSVLLASVLFYPSVVREGTNLLDGVKWSGLNAQSGMREYTVHQGGPFSAEDTVRNVKTLRETYGYWMCNAKVYPNRDYLVGYWVRFEDAKTLLWMKGKNASTGATEDQRLYCFGGILKYLDNYFSDEMKIALRGDSNAWRLCFRTLKFSKPLKGDRLSVSGGCYLSEGEMEFSNPFLVDVTDNKDYSLTIDISNSKPVSKLVIFRVGINDTVWERSFEKPVATAKIKVPINVADYRLGQESDKNIINGHGLDVFYVDGSSEKIYAPQEHAFKVRMDD